MVTTERAVFDYTDPLRPSLRASVYDPASLEAAIDAQGYRGFDVPRPPGSPPAEK